MIWSSSTSISSAPKSISSNSNSSESTPSPLILKKQTLLNREGLHLFALEVEGMRGQPIMIKTRVPREFLNLMKGGDSPKPAKRRGLNVKFGSSSKGKRTLKQRNSK